MSDADKASIKHVDDVDVDGIDRHLAVKYPDSLVGLSDEELANVDRRATRKIDILLMPTLMALYVLNYLVSSNERTAPRLHVGDRWAAAMVVSRQTCGRWATLTLRTGRTSQQPRLAA